MKFGLSASDYQLLDELVIQPLKQMSKVYIFGSRATGKNHPFSDVDLLFVPQVPGQPTGGELSRIKEEIEESRFPVKVDLVNIDDLAQSYRDRVLAERIEI